MVKARFAGIRGGGIAAGVAVLSASMVGLPTGAGAMGAAGAAVEQAPTCMGEPATIVADGGPIMGTGGPDVIVGSASPDEIDPRGGRDLVCALGSDDDVRDDDAVRDRVQMGAGTDRFRTGPGAVAWVDGGFPRNDPSIESDLIIYGDRTGITVDLRAHTDSHDNRLFGIENVGGTERRDVITGTSVRNVFFESGGPDVMRGLEGADQFVLLGRPQGWSVAARLIGGPGDDLMYTSGNGRTVMLGGAGDDDLSGGNSSDRLNGGRGDDHLRGGLGDDAFRGGDGADRLDADSGDDTMAGGAGHDLWRNWNPAGVPNGEHVTTVRIGPGTVQDRVRDEVFHDSLAGLEVYRGNRDLERFHGSSRSDLVHANGTEGALVDLIFGRGGDDRLTAPRHGEIFGGPGNDYCRAEQTHGCER
jgi:Ca2+-binding RTX toxin-like protein